MSKFSIGQKVRFRRDGEIGEHNEIFYKELCDINKEYVVLDVVTSGMIILSDSEDYWGDSEDYWVTPIQIELVPEPTPKFANIKVGQYVEHLNGTHLLVTAIKQPESMKSPHAIDRNPKFRCSNGNTYSVFDGSCIHDKDRIVRILSTKEVIVDFGSGIKGTIKRVGESISVIDERGIKVAWILISLLSAQTRAIVESLLKAQEEVK